MLFLVPDVETGASSVERDAYSFLRLVVEQEVDPAAAWTNRLGQRLSVDLLLRHTWDHYLERSRRSEGSDDHSELHLVELLLAYHDRGAGGPASAASRLDPNVLKERFLAVELARRGPDLDDETLAHYAESLGWLLEDSHVHWSVDERSLVRDWLAWLEESRFRDPAAVELSYLAHLLKGLRAVRVHRAKLTPHQAL